MTKKIALILIVVIIFVGIGYIFSSRNNEEDVTEEIQERETVQEPQITPVDFEQTFEELPRSDNITINDVNMNNFFAKSRISETTSLVEIVENNQYVINYLNKFNLFTIIIKSSPFEEHRQSAEQELLRILGINQEEACQLNVDITTPNYANPEQSGRIYELSFCE